MSISNEQLLAFIKKNPIGVGCGVLSLGLALAIYFRADRVPQQEKVRDEKEARSARLGANLTYGKDLAEQLLQFNEDVNAVNTRLIHAGDSLTNATYFFNLEKVVKNLSATPQTSAAQAAAQMKGKVNFAHIGYQLSVTGTYPQLIDLLTRLENGLHFCRVLNTSLKRGPGSNSEELLTLNLSIELLGLP